VEGVQKEYGRPPIFIFAVTPEQQEKFRVYLIEHMILCPRVRQLSFRQYAEEVIGAPIIHWRALSTGQARRVMSAAAKLKPQ